MPMRAIYTLQMLTPSVIELKRKAEKKIFDDMELVKVVAYVDPKSKGSHLIIHIFV